MSVLLFTASKVITEVSAALTVSVLLFTASKVINEVSAASTVSVLLFTASKVINDVSAATGASSVRFRLLSDSAIAELSSEMSTAAAKVLSVR